MTAKSSGEDSFLRSQHMAKAPASDANIGRDNVASSENNAGPAANVPKFLPNKFADANLGEPLEHADVNKLTQTGSLDGLVALGDHENNMLAVFNSGAMQMFNETNPEGFDLKTDVNQMKLEDSTSFVKTTGAELQDKTSVVGRSAG